MGDAEKFLERARVDLEHAKIARDNNEREKFVSEICESIEKALKAYMISNGKDFPKTHDLSRLHSESGISKFEGLCEDLGDAYVPSRYPNVKSARPENDKSLDLILSAEDLLEFIGDSL